MVTGLDAGIAGVLASALEEPPPTADRVERDAPAPEGLRGGLELLRQLVLERQPDELLVLEDSGTRALPAAQVSELLLELDRVRDEIAGKSTTEDRLVASTATVASGLSVGYVVWLVRGGMLVSSLLSSLPAWRLVDPLPVLGRMDDEDEGEDEGPGENADEGLDEMVEHAVESEER